RAEVGKAGLGTDRGELGYVDDDFVVWKLIGPGFDLGKLGIQAGLGVLRRVAGTLCHGFIVAATRSRQPPATSCQFEALSYQLSALSEGEQSAYFVIANTT